MYEERNVSMDTFAKRLRKRAKQLGISNAEAARHIGLEERRYAHYASGRREPDLATLKSISESLATTPNWLLGVVGASEKEPKRAELIGRFASTATGMAMEELELCIIPAEAVVAAKNLNGNEE